MKIIRSVDISQLTKLLTGEELLEGMSDGWRSRVRALSKAITFLESEPLLAMEVLSAIPALKSPVTSRVIGVTGLPGAGKSSLTNLIVREIRKKQKTVAVLAVDPSSPLSGGAVLGDRVRMQEHFKDAGVFIRSMSSRGALGGVARTTRSAIRLAGVLGFDYIIVETVGIGQSEGEIVELADTTLLVLMPNSGDEIQLMKAGVLQLADVYIVNKCDLASPARMINELHENTAPDNPDAWTPAVIAASSATGEGLQDVMHSIESHHVFEKTHPKGYEVRKQRAVKEILRALHHVVEPDFLALISEAEQNQLDEVIEGTRPALALAGELSKKFLRSVK
ncbi:MAG: methylmalonyl Co-A mutase-associated GTPase MeaB [Proteobacteria bacterium]|nr:methylmalonyl Co-A mutase-associated GTPase MeaB [Pseudomonadota bacterium]